MVVVIGKSILIKLGFDPMNDSNDELTWYWDRLSIPALADVNAWFVVVTDNCNSSKGKSWSWKQSVIWENSNVKPWSSAYLDKNS